MNSSPNSNVQTEIKTVEADWDDENSRVEVRVELGLNASPLNVVVSVQRVRYWVTILAEV